VGGLWLGNMKFNPVDGSKMVVVSKCSVLTAGRQLIISNKNILRKSSRLREGYTIIEREKSYTWMSADMS
jgi:hypothetical protein